MSKHTFKQNSRLAKKQGITLHQSLGQRYPRGTWFWCIHHEAMMEALKQGLQARIHYILTEKPEHEREVRLRALRPVKDQALARKWFKQHGGVACAHGYGRCGVATRTMRALWHKEYPNHPRFDDIYGLKF